MINVPGLGRKNPVDDWETITWFLDQTTKKKNQNFKTRFYLDLKERWFPSLMKESAYELMGFINSQVTIQQEKNRAQWREKLRKKNELELKVAKQYTDKYKMMKILMSHITPN